MKRLPNLRPTAYGLQPVSPRRGVLLLVVLSLLVLFALIGVTFVLVAGQSKRIIRADNRAEQYGDDYRRQIDDVFAQIIRDTTNPQSSLRGHSLLNDIYGIDGLKMAYTGAILTPGANGQFIDLTVDTSNATFFTPTGTPNPITPAQILTPGFFNGCVLTMIDGPAKDQSTRIVGWGMNGATFQARVMAFDGISASTVVATTSGNILINGRPFNGTGFGYNSLSTSTTYLNNADSNNNPYALLPNGRFFQPNTASATNTLYNAFGGFGGADEDYDIADPQNMLLGSIPPHPIAPPTVTPNPIIPSMHRPELAAYWKNQGSWNATVARQAIMRPLGTFTIAGSPSGITAPNIDHPNFTGSNPSFDAVNGPWDVDNDGDGIPESVWVDVGLPVQTAPDGRKFKPLVAILTVDLDGRLNVNAHGSVVQADTNYNTILSATPPGKPIMPSGGVGAATMADYVYSNSGGPPAAGVQLPRGLGYGPAEVNLGLTPGIFNNPAVDYPNFFIGITVGSKAYEGRYGEYGTAAQPLPGITTAGGGSDDLLELLKRPDLPAAYNYYSGIATDYGSPIDLWGRSVLGIDYAGQPILAYLNSPPLNQATGNLMGTAITGSENLNNPYTLDLARNRARPTGGTGMIDNPFAASELERILRSFDIDASALPDRLQTLLSPPPSSNPNDLARLVTTDSFDLPVPSSLPTRDMEAGIVLLNQLLASQVPPTAPISAANMSVADMLRMKMLSALASVRASVTAPPFNPPITIADLITIDNQIATLLPPDVMAGLRFDLNRPFGNGQDDDGNGVVDEPTLSEFNVKKELPANWSTVLGSLPGLGTLAMDLNNDGSAGDTASTFNDLYARQLYAKHLYILTMLFVDQTSLWSQESGITPALQQELLARRVAQWAINVVDFRDPDSIMTPFEYDVNPFNADGWSVDGTLAIDPTTTKDYDAGKPDRRLVWGCEYPELLLTETLALHDRRVADKKDDDRPDGGNDRAKSKTTNPIDQTLDQVRVPQGSLFLEFYCPRIINGSQRSFPRELYDINGRLNLGAIPPGAGAAGYPVWRVAIAGSTYPGIGSNANNISTRTQNNPDTTNLDPVQLAGASADPNHFSVFDPLCPPPGQLTIERLIWFSANDPTTNPDASLIFYNKSGTSTLLNPGQYAVVGPRPTTYFGKAIGSTTAAVQRIDLDTANTQVTYVPANGNAPNNITTTFATLPIICSSSALPTGWASASFPNNIGVSISEPLFSVTATSTPPGTYYPAPSVATSDPAGLNPAGVLDTYSQPLDKPQDSAAGVTNAPLFKDGMLSTGVKPNYKTALLQRLANPLIPYDVTANPYITVDWQPIDLTVFNGEAQQGTTPAAPTLFDPDDPVMQPPTGPPPLFAVGGRERGSASAALWNLMPQQQTTTQAPIGGTAVFDYNVNQTLGYLNKALGLPWASPPAAQAGYKGAPDPNNGNTFPWLNWNNRPYISNMELLLVPATSAEQLVRQFGSTPISTSQSPYVPAVNAFQTPCPHLLNFFLTADGTGGKAPYFYRVLDYLHVPSRFVGTETFLSPTQFSNVLTNEQPMMSMFHPPFNKVSNYRDPGRVNLNTIASDATTGNNAVWTGILNGPPQGVSPGPNWATVLGSMQKGFTLGTNPSRFTNPFRSAAGAAFTLPGAPPMLSEIEATLLRSDPTNVVQPLFLSQLAAAQPYSDPNRNPYFRYQLLSRLSNSLTTRSNVYAIWITVGYFEVTQAPIDASIIPPGINYNTYPDGYQLGQELGSDTGDIKRHRGFYIYDRSIPVGFEPGKDHNIDKGVLLKRFIE